MEEIKVITKVVLLDIIYPGYWDEQLYLKISYEASNKAVDKWAKDNNYFVYEDWKPNFSKFVGVNMAIKNGNIGVILDCLS